MTDFARPVHGVGQGDIAAEAVKAGSPGVAFLRVLEDGEIDAAKPIKEGLSAEAVAAVLEASAAQPVRPRPCLSPSCGLPRASPCVGT